MPLNTTFVKSIRRRNQSKESLPYSLEDPPMEDRIDSVPEVFHLSETCDMTRPKRKLIRAFTPVEDLLKIEEEGEEYCSLPLVNQLHRCEPSNPVQDELLRNGCYHGAARFPSDDIGISKPVLIFCTIVSSFFFIYCLLPLLAQLYGH